MAHFILAPDPINKPHDLTSEEVKGVTISQWLNSYYKKHGAFDRPMMCIVDNEVVEFSEFYRFRPTDSQNVVFTPRVEGLVSIIITVISLVVSVYLALSMSVPENTNSEYESAPSYSLQGRSNRRKLGEPIEVHFGRISKYYPSYAAASYTRFVGGEQKLYQLFCVGYGDQDFDSSDIRIKDTPIDNYEDVQLEVTRPFGQPTLFATNVETSINVSNTELLGPNEAGFPGFYGPFAAGADPATDEVYRIEIDLEWPNGLYAQASDGGIDSRTTQIQSYYQELDDVGDPVGSEVLWLDTTKTSKTTSPIRETFTLETPNPLATYTIKTGRVNDAFGNTNIRITDKVLWTGLKSFKSSPDNYGNVTLLSVETTASNSISGSAAQSVNLDFTAYSCAPDGGQMSYGPTRSIVAAFVAVFTNEYGAGLEGRVMDWDTLLAIDAEMEAEGRYFDWTFDQTTTVWEAAKAIARCARATPIMTGSFITMRRDVLISQPEAIFTPYNMVENSFSKNFTLSKINDADGVEIEYIDIDSGNQEKILCLLGDDVGARPERVQFIGQRDRDWAYREGLFIRAQRKLLREQVRFTTGLEGLPVQYGSRIAVASGVDQKESIFGRVVDVVGTTVTVDQPLTFNMGIVYGLALRTVTGGVSGTYTVTEGANEFEAILPATIPNDWQTTDGQEPAFFVFGEAVFGDYKVTAVVPQGGEEVSIEAINYDETVYSYDTETAPAAPVAPAVPVVPDLPVVETVQLVQLDDLTVGHVSWTPALGATSYIVQTSLDGVEYSTAGTVTTLSLDVTVPVGTFWVRVAGIGSARGPWSLWTGETGVATLPPADAQNFRLLNPFVGQACQTIWDAEQLAESYNVKVYELPADSLIFDDSVLQTSYSFTAEDVAAVTTVVRDFRLELLAVNSIGTSETAAELVVNNPAPVALTGLASEVLTETDDYLDYLVSWTITSETDLAFYRVWASESDGFTPAPGNVSSEGVTNSATIRIAKDANGKFPTTYWNAAAVDVWGDDTNPAAQQLIQGTQTLLVDDLDNDLVDDLDNTLTS